jgi:hypothetical protein
MKPTAQLYNDIKTNSKESVCTLHTVAMSLEAADKKDKLFSLFLEFPQQ